MPSKNMGLDMENTKVEIKSPSPTSRDISPESTPIRNMISWISVSRGWRNLLIMLFNQCMGRLILRKGRIVLRFVFGEVCCNFLDLRIGLHDWFKFLNMANRDQHQPLPWNKFSNTCSVDPINDRTRVLNSPRSTVSATVSLSYSKI